MVVAVVLAVVGVAIGETSGSADTRSLERIGMVLPLIVYSCWWVYVEISEMRKSHAAESAASTAAGATAVEVLFDAAEVAATDVPAPVPAGRPSLSEIDDETRASYQTSLTRPVTVVPSELRPGFRNAG